MVIGMRKSWGRRRFRWGRLRDLAVAALVVGSLVSACATDDAPKEGEPIHAGASGLVGPTQTGGGLLGGQDECGHCASLRVPGCCAGAWECPDGECVFRCDGGATPPLIWDLDAIEGEPLNTVVDQEEGYPQTARGGIKVHSVWFDSWEWLNHPDEDGSVGRRTIPIHALIGVPPSLSGPAPGLLIGHGLTEQVSWDDVVGYAANYGVVTIGISAPGNGESWGHGTQKPEGTVCNLFETDPDPRGSWLYAYAVAGMRALTYLGTLPDEVASIPDVDMSRLAVTGGSGGGLLSLLVGGIDRRIVASIPGSASGALDLAIEANGWEVDMLDECFSPEEQPERLRHLQNFLDFVDPINYAETACGATFLVNGFQDEYFPVTSTKATYQALLRSGKDVRWLVLPNFDHGYFADLLHDFCVSDAPGLSSKAGSLTEALRRADVAGGYWLRRYLLEDPANLPTVPTLTAVAGTEPGTAKFTLTVDAPPKGWRIDDTRVWISTDDACSLGVRTNRNGYPMAADPTDSTRRTATISLSAALEEIVYWGEVTYLMPSAVYHADDLADYSRRRISFSSVPVLPQGFVPVVRPSAPEGSGTTVDPCMPGTCTRAP